MHEQLRDEFRHRIDSGSWPEGHPVPSEAVLCQEFGASRGPVRQALAALRHDGAISGGRGKPAVVRPAVISQSVETFMSFTEWSESMGRVPGQQTQEITGRAGGRTTGIAGRRPRGEPPAAAPARRRTRHG
ncbi:MAG: GntR family transcriptional regulator [Specibacter sp.]